MTIRSEVIAALGQIDSLAAFGDFAPDKQPLPYTTMLLDISEVPVLSGDGRTLMTEGLMQVDLWEDRAAEDGTLRAAVWAALDGLKIASAACRLRVRSAPRIPDPDFGIVHRAFTVAAIRNVATAPIPDPLDLGFALLLESAEGVIQ